MQILKLFDQLNLWRKYCTTSIKLFIVYLYKWNVIFFASRRADPEMPFQKIRTWPKIPSIEDLDIRAIFQSEIFLSLHNPAFVWPGRHICDDSRNDHHRFRCSLTKWKTDKGCPDNEFFICKIWSLVWMVRGGEVGVDRHSTEVALSLHT